MRQDGSASAPVFYQNVGKATLAAWHTQNMGIDAAAAQILMVEFGIVIGACRAHVAAPQTPSGDRSNRGGDLAAQAYLAGDRVGLAVARGKIAQAEDDVGGVFANAGEVRKGKRPVAEAYLKSSKKQKQGIGACRVL